MRLHRLEIHNYKSLRNVAIEPTPISAFVGPNASGKTNLAEAIEFLGYAYKWDLEAAVSQGGGYDNLLYRNVRRSRQSLAFKVVGAIPWISAESVRFKGDEGLCGGDLIVAHSFSLRPKSRAIHFPAVVESEEISFLYRTTPMGVPEEFFRINRAGQRVTVERGTLKGLNAQKVLSFSRGQGKLEDFLLKQFKQMVGPGDLILAKSPAISARTQGLEKLMASGRAFQLNPKSCRGPGIAGSVAGLDRYGGNLPGALGFLKEAYPKEYALILDISRRIMPSLEDITIGFTPSRALGIFLKERGFMYPWTADEISDGTIQTLAILTAVFDPRIGFLVIEESENSVHSWALRNLVEAFRLASDKKQILLTTHSPILLDQLKPEEVWVVRKPGTATKIDPLLNLDPSLKESWGQGKFTLSDYLDSGAVPEAVPAVNS